MDNNRYCVIMCGGVGSRFWPFSREAKPKQFIDFFGTGSSLLQMTVARLRGIVPVENIILMTNSRYAEVIAEQLPELSSDQILLEPARRNTAPCIAWAAWHIAARNPQASIMVAPSDHLIIRTDEYAQAVRDSFDFVERHNSSLLTLGIKPSRPETGYGYIQRGTPIEGAFSTVKTFTEKPDEQLARVFLDSGEFLWNSGMFFWSATAIINAMRTHAPEIAAVMDDGLELMASPREQEFINTAYERCPNISIDYAVMEKAAGVCVQQVDFGWSDLGTWGALYDVSPKGRDGNVVQNSRVLLQDCHRNVIAIKGHKVLVASGIDDYIIADTPDALLIIPKSDEQRLRQYVNEVRNTYGDLV
ncbi:MAG: mannose-1-phosphate guanylyltransferase [Muribaculaceae bacterium]|nr:mannose-1-phosphate guanylyltransferase [Muribaculaceae bacterium]